MSAPRLLERAKFLAIFTSNLDEFFMKREAVLRQWDHRCAARLVAAASRQAAALACGARQSAIASHRSRPCRAWSLPAFWDELTPRQQEEGSKYFESEVSPALTPLVIDPVHPFPFLSNLSNSLVFRLRDVARDESMFARVKVPGMYSSSGFPWSRTRIRSKAAGAPLRGNTRQLHKPLQRHGNQRRHYGADHTRRRG